MDHDGAAVTRDKDGARRSTIRDVAARAGVSVATVSRVMNDNYPAAPATRRKVMEAVSDLGYVANPHARALNRQGLPIIAMVIFSIDQGFYGELAQSVATSATLAGRLCMIATTGHESGRELETIKLMRDQGVEAIIAIAGVYGHGDYQERMAEIAESLHKEGSRLVLCARPSLGPGVPAPSVEYDNTGGAYAGTSYLLARGHRRILFLGGPEGHSSLPPRLAGYRQAIADLGGAGGPELEVTGLAGRTPGYTMMRRILTEGPPSFTAVFAYNDAIAGGAIQALREAGLSVPDDISVIGYDDVPPAADLRLTTIRVPTAELGRVAVSLATESADPYQHIVVPTHLAVRDSVRPRP